MTPVRTFLIRRVTEDRVEQVRLFQESRPSEFLWPRTPAELLKYAADECLYEALEENGTAVSMVGMCYVVLATDLSGNPRMEFGGLNVSDGCRGLGVAAALGTVAISTQLGWDPKPEKVPLIAHVHEENKLPRNVLSQHLGFADTGKQEVPPVEPPPSMKRNASGQVVGDLFAFQNRQLMTFADWIEEFDGVLRGKGTESNLKLTEKFLKRRGALVAALREQAGG